MITLCREETLVSVNCLLYKMRVEVNKFLILKANKVKRMARSAPDYPEKAITDEQACNNNDPGK